MVSVTTEASRTELPERNSPKAARILCAASELLTARGAKGFTVADVAHRAHVGKGTVYLYWTTKEDLLIGLIGRTFLTVVEELIEMLTNDPELARPSRFCPMILQAATGNPLIAAVQGHDDELLGILADHPRSMALHNALGPSGLLNGILPIWRENKLARTDWETADQAFALHALITGIALSIIGPVQGPAAAEPMAVFSAAVTALLGTAHASDKQVRGTAADIVAVLRGRKSAALDVINAPGS